MADEQLGRKFRGERGERGHRGERGERGKRGHTGAAGVGVGGLLKFSGTATPSFETTAVSYLADVGVGAGIGLISTAPSYPVAIAHSLVNFATNMLADFTVPASASVVFALLQNGAAVPGFAITYGPDEFGIKTLVAGPVAYAIGDTFDVRVTVNGLISDPIDVSATVGIV